MECFFVKTAVCTTNIITWPDYSWIAKGANSAASYVCSINNSTGWVSTGLSLMLVSLVGAPVQMVNDNKNQGLM